MATYNISNAVASDMENNVEDITVDSAYTDAATGEQETEWICSNWGQWYGYFVKIPEIQQAIVTRATWVLGKGFEADIHTTNVLDMITGDGHDNFNNILKNMIITKRICGDAYCEIVRDKEGTLLNLKPLDPSSIKIIVDKQGRIKRYEQINKTTKKATLTFQPNEIFRLSNKMVADNIHGLGDIESVEEIIKANNEIFFDTKKLMHRHVKPIMAFKLDTDDTTKINAFAAKMDSIVNLGENIYIPKDTVEFELVAVPSNSTLNPLPWREHLKNYFYQVVGIPQIILGNASEFSESAAKIAYLSFEQSVEEEQLDIETQVWNQLFLKIQLTFPATIQNELISDTAKDGAMQQTDFQPSDMMMTEGETNHG